MVKVLELIMKRIFKSEVIFGWIFYILFIRNVLGIKKFNNSEIDRISVIINFKIICKKYL